MKVLFFCACRNPFPAKPHGTVPFMPGRRMADKERAFFTIFSTMTGAVEIARMLPNPVREKVLDSARDFLLRNF
jgi:TetR/AcrR family transcriptional regulator, transcriptional repressor for nem operon